MSLDFRVLQPVRPPAATAGSCSHECACTPPAALWRRLRALAQHGWLTRCPCPVPTLLSPAVSCADGNSRVSLELPCLSEAIVQAMMGPQLLAKASNGKKQLQVLGLCSTAWMAGAAHMLRVCLQQWLYPRVTARWQRLQPHCSSGTSSMLS